MNQEPDPWDQPSAIAHHKCTLLKHKHVEITRIIESSSALGVAWAATSLLNAFTHKFRQ